MTEKKIIIVFAEGVDLNGSSPAVEKLKKKAALLPNACCQGLDALAATVPGAVKSAPAGLEAVFEANAPLAMVVGGEAELEAALEAADRRTVLAVATAKGVALTGMAIDSKAGNVQRTVNAQDILVTLCMIADVPVTAECTGGIIYQALKNPNLKLDEISKLKEAIVRMESVIQRDNREPWEKHDCA